MERRDVFCFLWCVNGWAAWEGGDLSPSTDHQRFIKADPPCTRGVREEWIKRGEDRFRGSHKCYSSRAGKSTRLSEKGVGGR
jgi:hypothetical protein